MISLSSVRARLVAGVLLLTPAAMVSAQTPAPETITAAAKTDSAAAAARAEHEARIAWFREAKYGLFIHWGLYAIPAGEWKGQRSPGIGEWIMNRMKIPVTEYEQLASQFNPVKFDAEAWVKMAQDAGMRYIVITAKHHDGFAMYHSKVSPYNVVDATPFKRDPVKELADACARHGMRFGFYYSQAQDWHEAGGAGNNWDFPENDVKDRSGAYETYIRKKAEPQIRELMQNYGPVCLIWFDTPQMMTKERGQLFANAVRSLQPATLIDGRLGPETPGDYQSTGDNAIPPAAKDGDWETPATLNHTWGFRKDDHDWKSPGDVVFKLVDIVSKGGNYLLNVGPTAEGVIPQPSQDALRTVGTWLKANGEAVYGAARSPFGEEFGDYAATLKTPAGKPVFLTRNEWRCTAKPGKLYFTLFRVERVGQEGVFALPAFKNAIKAAYMLDDAKRTPLAIKTGPDGARTLTVSRFINDTMGGVIVIEMEGGTVAR